MVQTNINKLFDLCKEDTINDVQTVQAIMIKYREHSLWSRKWINMNLVWLKKCLFSGNNMPCDL